MKTFVWALAIVAALLIGVALLALRAQRGVDCPNQVVIVRGRSGEPIECICIDGVLSTCFEPGP